MSGPVVVSVIVPVFNADKTLAHCLESLLTQTYKDLEILLINDCSTDGSQTTMIKYQNSLPESSGTSIKILQHETNRGVATARNTGLNNAAGEYIYYVDADDWIEPETLEILVTEAQKQGACIAGHELWMKYEKERHIKMPDVNNGVDAFKKMASGQLRWNLWLYLVKRSLYEKNNIRFLDGMNMGEDMMVMGKLFLCAKNIAIVHEPFYHYVAYNPTSLTKDTSDLRIDQITANINELERFVKDLSNAHLRDYIQYLKLQAKVPLLFSNKVSDYKKWLEWLPEANSYALKNKMSPLRTRILQYFAINRYFAALKLHYWLTNSAIKLFFH